MKLDSLASLRARFGVTSAQTLFYATAGIAWLRGDYTAFNYQSKNGHTKRHSKGHTTTGSTILDTTGFVFGGGMEHALRDNLLIRFEGLHYKFDDRISTSNLTKASDPDDFAEVEDITVYRVGLSYRFNLGGRQQPSSLK